MQGIKDKSFTIIIYKTPYKPTKEFNKNCKLDKKKNK